MRAAGDGESSMVALGAEVARKRQCVACHTLDGQRRVGPTWLGLYGATIPLADGRAVIADEAYLTRSMMEPSVEVHAGFPALMPSYLGILEAQEASALVELTASWRSTTRSPGGSSIRRAAAIRCCSSTCSGSTATPPSTS